MADPRPSRYRKRWTALQNHRLPHFKQWQLLTDWLYARRGRYLTSRRDKPRWNSNIQNDTPVWAVNVHAAGFMSGGTSPARRWFRLTTPDPAMAERRAVKDWLGVVEFRMREVIRQSNFYNSVHELYAERGVFGTALMLMPRHPTRIVHCYTQSAGMYCLALGNDRSVNTFYREDRMTAEQLIGTFGKDRCSTQVVNAYNKGDYDQEFDIVHLVEPREIRDIDRPDALNKPYRSVYFEKGGEGSDIGYDERKLLRVSGFDIRPFVAPRYDVLGNDAYGTGPGHQALGGARALQNEERRKAQAIDRMSNPPMTGPTSLENRVTTSLPGGVTYVPGGGGSNDRFQPQYLLDPRITELGEDIRLVEDRLARAFMADLFQMMIMDDRRQPATATEIAERHEEKLLMLGPALERQNFELLDPAIDTIFQYMWDADMIPPPPKELELVPLRVEYVSILHQAQRAVATAGIHRLTNYVQQISETHPESRHKFDAAQAVDDYGAALGVGPRLVVPDEEYQRLVAEERRAQAQQYAAEMAGQAADTAAKLGNTPGSQATESNVLQDLMGRAGAALQ